MTDTTTKRIGPAAWFGKDERLYSAGDAMLLERGYQVAVTRYEKEIADYKAQATLTYCVYCGATFPVDNKAGDKVTEHINTCEKHPLFQARVRITELEAELSFAKNGL